MDPVSALGIASGIIAVLQMTGTLISQSYGYIYALKDAPKDLHTLVQELSSLSGILSALKVQLENDPQNHQSLALEVLNKPGGPLDSCKKILGRVEKRLKKPDDRKLGSYLVGPLKDKVIRQDIEQLERLKSVFQLALYADQMTLSKAIEDYLRKTLEDYKQEQQVLGEHIRDTDDNVAELCRESKRRELEGKAAEGYVRNALDESSKTQEIIENHARETHDKVTDLCHETNQRIAEEEKRREVERWEKIVQWLSTIDYQSNHHAARSLQQPGTGDWFVGGQDFRQWFGTAGSVLWLHGIPGAGKTILTSTIIQKVLSAHSNPPNDDIAIIYFYFDFKDHAKQTTAGMLGSLTAQLLRKLNKTPDEADTLFKKHNETMLPTLSELLELLKTMLARFTRCFVIIDALDECNERQTLLSTLDGLIGVEGPQNTSILFTSRKEHDIETSFSKHPIITCILIQNQQVDADVSLYITEVIGKDELLKKFDEGLREDIRIALVKGSRGMFRWVKCQLDIIRELKRPKVIRDALKSLPTTLDDTYDRILLSIRTDDDKELMRRALQLVVYAARPMTLKEVAEAVVIEEGAESLEQGNRFFQPKDLLSICGSIFSFTGRNLGLSHYSIQEYLVSERIRNGPASRFAIDETRADIEISRICLTYLGFNDFEAGICLSKDDYNKRLRSFPLLSYAAKYWFQHMKSEAIEERIVELAVRVWGPVGTPKYMSWRQAYHTRSSYHWGRREGKWFSRSTYSNLCTLYDPSAWGLVNITRQLLEMGASCDAIDELSGSTALHAAVKGRHEKVVETLLQHGADPNIQCDDGATLSPGRSTALYTAVKGRHEKVVETLLQHGADPNIQYYDWTALYAAAKGGHEKMVETLLQHGADLNIKYRYGTALYAAAKEGYEIIVETLLQHGADPNIMCEYGTALYEAADGGHEKVVETLLQHGADLNIKCRYGTALYAAAKEGYEIIVETLLQHGADPNTQYYDWTALYEAADGGHEKVVETLLQHGADPNIIYIDGTALHAAAKRGHGKVVETLLQYGADPNIQYNFGATLSPERSTALYAAVKGMHEKVVETLLQHGADPNIIYIDGTAIHAATRRGHKKVVETLLQHGADPNIQYNFETVLYVAAEWGHEKIVETLLQHGADPNIEGVFGKPLPIVAREFMKKWGF